MKIFDTFKQTYQVERRANGAYNPETGYYEKGQLITFNIKASVDPTPAEVMLTLPEGYRTSETYTLYTDTELKTADVRGEISDIVILNNNNNRFRVIKVAHWRNTILRYYEIIVSKEGIDAD